MVFSSYIFVFVFLPVTLAGYFLLARCKRPIFQKLFLIAASLLFYGWFHPAYLGVIAASVLGSYGAARGMRAGGGRFKKPVFAAGVAFNLALLGYFKYYDFFAENCNAVFGMSLPIKHILLPLGVSFFTFQQLSFLVSAYKGGAEEKAPAFVDYCLFVVFFPQLVAGPIVLYEEMMPQFCDEGRRRLQFENLARGLFLFSVGLFSKLVLADSAAVLVDNGFGADALTLAGAWTTALAYTAQLFFDFGGYASMAIGLGRMFNIELPENFNRPYRAESIRDFWRRWHITLGRALSTYIYIPLGGNRKGKARTCLNLFLTFLASGVWHGAAWTFVLWGALHGLLAVLETLFDGALGRIPAALRRIGTFLTVSALWVLFRAEDFAQAGRVYRGMVNVGEIGLWQLADLAVDGVIGFPAPVRIAYALLFTALLTVLACLWRGDGERLARFRAGRGQMIAAALLFCLSVLHLGRESIFIYFNF